MFWLLSLFLPTLEAGGKVIIGIEVALQFMNPFAWLFGPLLLMLASLTNVLFLVQVGHLRRKRLKSSGVSPAPVAISLFINLLAILSLLASSDSKAFAPNLISQPGAWVWLVAYFLLLVGTARGERI